MEIVSRAFNETSEKIEFAFGQNGPSEKELNDTIIYLQSKLKEYETDKITCVFSKPVWVDVYGGKSVHQMDVRFFKRGTPEKWCYTRTRRHGYYFTPNLIANLQSLFIENEKEKKEIRQAKAFATFVRRLEREKYAKTWTHLNAEDFHDGYRFRDIRKVFDSYEIREIEYAFQNKTPLHIKNHTSSPTGRDFSVEGKWSEENDSYQAWFSSEFPGCLNGDYYLLLNPYIAVFYERD